MLFSSEREAAVERVALNQQGNLTDILIAT